MVVLSHPTTNTNSVAAARGLYKYGLLSSFFTCISWNEDGLLARTLPGSLKRSLNKRKRIDIPPDLIRTHPFREAMRILCERAKIYRDHVKEKAFFSTEQVYYDLDRYIARQLHRFPDLRSVYAYDDGALAHFEQAKKQGLTCIYDLPIGHWRSLKQISSEEMEAQPDWSGTMKALEESDEKHDRKDAEIQLADLVVVASTFTKKTLELFPGKKKIVVVPYGMPRVVAPPREITSSNHPLRVLFVGSLTQRKGISYLIEAVKRMSNAVSLTLIGTRGGTGRALDQACASFRWLERLPRSQVLQEMQSHDVLVFPSLFEGFGLVIGEALSQGLPVITTSHTGAPDVMRDGVEGFIVPIRSAEAIAEKLELLNRDRTLLKQMSDSARLRAMACSWDTFETKLAYVVSNELTPLRIPKLVLQESEKSRFISRRIVPTLRFGINGEDLSLK